MTSGSRTASADVGDADWWMLVLAWLLYFSFALTVASLFPIAGEVREDLGLTYGQVGLVLGSWQLLYLLAAIPVGYLVDRFQPKLVLFIGILVICGSQLARSYAESFVTLFLAVALLGLGGPVVSVGLPKVIAEFFTGRRRTTASGIYITGSHVGQMTALATTAVLANAVGDWRVALRCFAGVVLVVAMLWLGFAKEVRRNVPATGASIISGIRHVVKVPGMWLIVGVGFSGFLASHGYRSWLPEMLSAKGMSATEAGLVAALPAVCAMAGSIMILHLGGRRHRRMITIGLLAVVGVAMVGAAIANGPLLLLFVSIEGFCGAALMPLMMNSLMEMPDLGPQYMGAAAGLYFTVGEIGGFAGPSLVGASVSFTGSFLLGVLALAGVMWSMIILASRMPVPQDSRPNGQVSKYR